MQKLAFTLLLSAALLASSCGKKQGDASSRQAATERVDTLSALVMQIQKCSRLYTTEFRVHKIITHDDRLALKGRLLNHDYDIGLPLGKRKIAIPVDATLKAYVDFSGFSAANVRRDSSHIEIVLPDPRIVLTSTRVNHDDIKKYVALLRHNFTDAELASYERQGRDAIIRDMASTDIIEQARSGAANALVPILKQMGFKEENITISFRKQFAPNDILQLIDNTSVEKRKSSDGKRISPVLKPQPSNNNEK